MKSKLNLQFPKYGSITPLSMRFNLSDIPKSKLAQRGHTYASTAQRAKLENLPRTRTARFWIKWQLPIFFLLRIEIIILSRHFFQNKYTVHTLCVAACSQTGRGRSESNNWSIAVLKQSFRGAKSRRRCIFSFRLAEHFLVLQFMLPPG